MPVRQAPCASKTGLHLLRIFNGLQGWIQQRDYYLMGCVNQMNHCRGCIKCSLAEVIHLIFCRAEKEFGLTDQLTWPLNMELKVQYYKLITFF